MWTPGGVYGFVKTVTTGRCGLTTLRQRQTARRRTGCWDSPILRRTTLPTRLRTAPPTYAACSVTDREEYILWKRAITVLWYTTMRQIWRMERMRATFWVRQILRQMPPRLPRRQTASISRTPCSSIKPEIRSGWRTRGIIACSVLTSATPRSRRICLQTGCWASRP